MYGLYGESSSKRALGLGFAPNGEFDETWTKRVVRARRARSSTSSVPPTFTSKNSRVRSTGWITAAAWNTVAPSIAVEEPIGRDRVAHVADDRLDLRAHELEQRRLVRVVHEAAHPVPRLDERRARGSCPASRTRR